MAHCAVPEIPFDYRRAFSLGEVAAMTGLSVPTLYNEMQRGRLKTIKLAGRRLVTLRSHRHVHLGGKQAIVRAALRPNIGSPEGRFFRLAHDGGLVAPT
jgi:predicted DNA-binding transcriptional regulator AlpA